MKGATKFLYSALGFLAATTIFFGLYFVIQVNSNNAIQVGGSNNRIEQKIEPQQPVPATTIPNQIPQNQTPSPQPPPPVSESQESVSVQPVSAISRSSTQSPAPYYRPAPRMQVVEDADEEEEAEVYDEVECETVIIVEDCAEEVDP